MSGDIRSAFITLALSLPAIVLCLSIHETAHGGAAYLLGDRTARDSGRVTLSPMAHIDPIGFLCLLLFGFGWARPVPVNIANFRNRRWGMALTALAGPVSNFITAFIAYCLILWCA
ncbi:MAG: site-2 protease family protein [Butyricicoccus sp.]